MNCNNAEGDPRQRTPQVHDVTTGNAEPISIDQVIAEEGPRSPAVESSQKIFRVGFILLIRPGDFPSDALMVKLYNARLGLAQRFNAETRGLGVIKTKLTESSALGIGNPTLVSGPPPLGGLADFAAALDWLLAAQHQVGFWQDQPGTTIRDTALALSALESLDFAGPALLSGRAWIGSQQADNVDETAWLLASGNLGANRQSVLDQLADGQHSDGGWGLETALASSPYDTALVLSWVRDPEAAALLSGASGFLLDMRRPGSGWGVMENGGNQIVPTALALDGLIRNDVDAGQLTEAFAWLAASQGPTGSFGEGAGSPHETALAMNALAL